MTDADRESRIIDEILVDAYVPEEWAVAWYSYLEDKFIFAFEAECIAVRATSPPRKGEVVEVLGLASEDDRNHTACRQALVGKFRASDQRSALTQPHLPPFAPDTLFTTEYKVDIF
jgi:hypothetical protein